MSAPDTTKDPQHRYHLAGAVVTEFFQLTVIQILGGNLFTKESSDKDPDSLIAMLSEQKWDISEQLKLMKEGLQETVEGDDPYAEGAQEYAKLLGFGWNEEAYRDYARTYGDAGFEIRVYDENESPEIMGLVSGIYTSIQILEELLTLMNEGRPIPPIYFEGNRVKFIEANEKQLVDITNRVFEELKADYEDTLKLGAVAKEDYCTIEIKMFQGLFEPGKSHFDAGYLSERMRLSKKEIKSVFQDRNAVLGGRFELTYSSYDEQKRCNYAILLAIQRYIKFLRAELPEGVELEKIATSKTGQDSNLKFSLLLPANKDTDYLKAKLEAMHFALSRGRDPIIECKTDIFVNVFLPNALPSGYIKWKKDNKSLRYFFWKLRGMDFDDKSEKDPLVIYKNENRSVFIDLIKDESEFKKCLKNCFRNENGGLVVPNSVISPKTKRQLDKELKARLDNILNIFLKA